MLPNYSQAFRHDNFNKLTNFVIHKHYAILFHILIARFNAANSGPRVGSAGAAGTESR